MFVAIASGFSTCRLDEAASQSAAPIPHHKTRTVSPHRHPPPTHTAVLIDDRSTVCRQGAATVPPVSTGRSPSPSLNPPPANSSRTLHESTMAKAPTQEAISRSLACARVSRELGRFELRRSSAEVTLLLRCTAATGAPVAFALAAFVRHSARCECRTCVLTRHCARCRSGRRACSYFGASAP